MCLDVTVGSAAIVVGAGIYIAIISSSAPMTAWMLTGIWLVSATAAMTEFTRT